MEKIKSFVTKHPQWTSWIVLAIGMVAILVWSARDVGLLPDVVAGCADWLPDPGCGFGRGSLAGRMRTRRRGTHRAGA